MVLLGWTTFAIYLIVALIEWRLGSLFYTILALLLALLVAWLLRSKDAPVWTIFLLLALLVSGLSRAYTGFNLIDFYI